MSVSAIAAVMGLLLTAALQVGGPAARPVSTWVRQDPQTLVFSGRITDQARVDFDEALTDETTTLILTSRGGQVDAALDIAEVIHARKLDVVVRGHCVSSCANYIFIAAENKTIEPDSFVGFHGTMTSFNLDKQLVAMARAEREDGRTDAEVAESAAFVTNEISTLRARERAFAEAVGFSPRLYIDAGFERLPEAVQEALPEGLPVLFPSANVLASCYGVTGVVDLSRAADSDLTTLGERGAPSMEFIVFGDEYFEHCDPVYAAMGEHGRGDPDRANEVLIIARDRAGDGGVGALPPLGQRQP